jgi:bifunctional non-homologous end joining protein LigD
MQRFPDGITESGFFQKDIGDHFPDWINRTRLSKKTGSVTHVVADQPAALVYLADQATITLHLALSRMDSPQYPDRMIFDLDPSDKSFSKVQEAARLLKKLFDSLDLISFVQTTGSRGLHIVVPLDQSHDFEAVREFSHRCCHYLATNNPKLLTVEQRRDKRGSRVFLDDLRNAYGQTAVAPYAVRARSGAPIATPLHWHEVWRKGLHAKRYHLGNLFQRLGQTQDPWRHLERSVQTLPRLSTIPVR